MLNSKQNKIRNKWLRAFAALGAGIILAGVSLPAQAAENSNGAETVEAAVTGMLHGYVYTHGSERGMKIASNPDASAGGVSWDLAAPKHKFHDKAADIWLIAENYAVDQLSDKVIEDWYRLGKIPAGAPIYHTKTDKAGKYAFQDLPAGKYFLLVIDSYGRDAAQNLTELDDKKQLFAKLPNVEEFEMFVIGSRSCLVQKVTITPGSDLEIKPGVL